MNSGIAFLLVLAAGMLASGTVYQSASGATDVEFTPEERQWLADHPTIIMGYNPAWAPYEYHDENGVIQGVTVAMAERFSDISGSQFVQAESITEWSDNIDGIRSGTIDMVFSAWAERSPSRESFMDFTDIWHQIPTDVVIRESDIGKISTENWHQYRVVIASGYSVDVWLEDNMPGLSYTTADTPLEALGMVLDESADVYLEPWDMARHLAISNGISGIASAGHMGDNYELVIGYAEGSAVFGSILQKMANALEDEKDQIISDAISRSFAALEHYACR